MHTITGDVKPSLAQQLQAKINSNPIPQPIDPLIDRLLTKKACDLTLLELQLVYDYKMKNGGQLVAIQQVRSYP